LKDQVVASFFESSQFQHLLNLSEETHSLAKNTEKATTQLDCRLRRVEASTCGDTSRTTDRRERGAAMIEDLKGLNKIEDFKLLRLSPAEPQLHLPANIQTEKGFCGFLQPILEKIASSKSPCP
jgi:hypothetical protein